MYVCMQCTYIVYISLKILTYNKYSSLTRIILLINTITGRSEAKGKGGCWGVGCCCCCLLLLQPKISDARTHAPTHPPTDPPHVTQLRTHAATHTRTHAARRHHTSFMHHFAYHTYILHASRHHADTQQRGKKKFFIFFLLFPVFWLLLLCVGFIIKRIN